jgi:hypothetical protein
MNGTRRKHSADGQAAARRSYRLKSGYAVVEQVDGMQNLVPEARHDQIARLDIVK